MLLYQKKKNQNVNESETTVVIKFILTKSKHEETFEYWRAVVSDLF